jgi:hypothetical protein
MPGSTPRLALPYPIGTDPINVPADIQALAEAVDATTAWVKTTSAGVYDMRVNTSVPVSFGPAPFTGIGVVTAMIQLGFSSGAGDGAAVMTTVLPNGQTWGTTTGVRPFGGGTWVSSPALVVHVPLTAGVEPAITLTFFMSAGLPNMYGAAHCAMQGAPGTWTTTTFDDPQPDLGDDMDPFR